MQGPLENIIASEVDCQKFVEPSHKIQFYSKRVLPKGPPPRRVQWRKLVDCGPIPRQVELVSSPMLNPRYVCSNLRGTVATRQQ